MTSLQENVLCCVRVAHTKCTVLAAQVSLLLSYLKILTFTARTHELFK